MASISCIEVANFLCDGYEPGAEWNPLYRGITLRLFGNPSALQIDNGGGKSSLTDGCLYLLSRDRRLKPKVEDRAAPVDKGWTHVRLEFIERDDDDDILQGDLISESRDDVPGTYYVVGLCWNRGKDPIFYRYRGTLAQAPAYRVVDDRMELVGNEAFKKSVEAQDRAIWNKWGNIADWQNEIGTFTNMDIIRQNVEFQLEGAGDYSAMVTKVKQRAGQRYDVMFFRQFVAPELLRRPLGDDSDAEEYKFEDALFRTLKPTATALMEISQKEKELQHASDALEELGPVERRAQDVVVAEAHFNQSLESMANSAALVDELARRDPLPGMPKVPDSRLWANEALLVSAVFHLAICRNNGVVITDAGLSELTGVSVGEINRRALSKKILIEPIPLGPWLCEQNYSAGPVEHGENEEITQVIDFKDHLKESDIKAETLAGSTGIAQVSDFKHHLKESGRGKHRKHPTAGYDLQGAMAAIDTVRGLSRVNLDKLQSVLPRVFGIGKEADTNSYRREVERLAEDHLQLVSQVADAEQRQARLREEISVLQRGEHELHECEVAYQNFRARAEEFPDAYREAPERAEQWALQALEKTNGLIAQHDERCGQLKEALARYVALKNQYNDLPLVTALEALREAYLSARTREDEAKCSLRDLQATLDGKRRNHLTATRARQTIELEHRELAALHAHQEQFVELFGDVDPDGINPQKALSEAHGRLRQSGDLLSRSQHSKAIADQAGERRALYRELFGDVAPAGLDPVGNLASLAAQIAAQNDIVTVEKPFLAALSVFRAAHADIAPQEWLREMERTKNALLTERIALTEERGRIEQEVADLDTFAVADERVYSQALKSLSDAGIAYTRLRELICSYAEGSRRETLLTLFSAALSVPVVGSLDDADRATALLERTKLTVPVFLMAGVRQFIEDGHIETQGSLAYTFLAGRRTRQVEVVLNPGLVVEEKQRAAARTAEIQGRLQQIQLEMTDYQSTSQGVMGAVAAGQALDRDSASRTHLAQTEIERLSPQRAAAAVRARPDALDAIEAQKGYIATGGDDGYRVLAEVTIPNLQQAIASITAEIELLSKQATAEAGAALTAMRRFKQAGGTDKLTTIAGQLSDARSAVDAMEGEIEEITTRLSFEIRPGAERARAELALLEESYSFKQERLSAAIEFESNGDLAFMEGRVETRVTLVASQSAYQKALAGIDFKRCARYLAQTATEDRSFTEQLAAAERQLGQTTSSIGEMQRRIQSINYRLAELQPFSDLLHALILMLANKLGQLDILPDDLRTNAARLATDPGILQNALDLQLACASAAPNTTDAIRAAIHNIVTTVAAIDLDPARINNLRRELTRARSEFVRERDDYCARARKGQIKGLQINEIERIEAARTVGDLAQLHELKQVIGLQVEREREAVQKISEAMQANKAATIDNLVQLARQADVNLKILNNVMKRHPSACFKIDVQVANEEKIADIINLLVSDIQDRETTRRTRDRVPSNSDIGERDEEYRSLIHDRIYKDLFLEPSVRFVHTAIRPKGETLFTAPGEQLSTGQHTALAMMWLVRHAEYAQARAVMTLGTKREQRIALKGSQRIMFFDGLFSNLSNEAYIDAAFHGLKDVGQSFQLIGLIHNPHYVNNTGIFPIHLVGKKRRDRAAGRERTFMTFNRSQPDNGVVYYMSAFKQERAE